MSELINLKKLGDFDILSSGVMPFSDTKINGSRLLLPINNQKTTTLYEKANACYMNQSFSKCTLVYDETQASRTIVPYNPLYTYEEKLNPTPLFDYGLIIPYCNITGTRDYSVIIDHLYPLETATGQPLPRPNTPQYDGLLTDVTDAGDLSIISQVSNYSEIKDSAGNKRYCGVKLLSVSPLSALAFSTLQNGDLEIPTLITSPAPTTVKCNFYFENYDYHYCNPVAGIMLARELITLPLRVRTWDIDNARYIYTNINYSVYIYLSAKFTAPLPAFSITNNFISGEQIQSDTYNLGTVITHTLRYRSAFKSFRDEWEAWFLYSANGGLFIANITGKGNKLLTRTFTKTTIARDVSLREFIFAISQNYNFYPLNSAYWLGGDAEFFPPYPAPPSGGISAPKFNIEFLYPNIMDNKIYSIDLGYEVGNTPYSMTTYGFDAFTVLFNYAYNNPEANNVKSLFFITRDGSGYFEVDITELIGDKILTYGGYDDGFILLGLTDSTDTITYILMEVGIPRARVGKIEYDFKKIGVAFIPCSTHCMGQGGIYSKY